MDAVMAKAEADIGEMLEAGQAEEALFASRELRRACQEAVDKVAEANTLMLMCNAFWELWRVDECIAAANEAEAMFAAEVQTQRQAEALIYIAEASYALDKCHPALHTARRAVRLFRRMGDDQKEVRARLLVCQALMATLARRTMPSAWSEAVDEAQAAVDAASQFGERELIAAAHLQAAQAKSGVGEALAALEQSGMAANIYRQLGWKPEEVATQLVSAQIYLESSNYEAALAIGQGALQLARECDSEELVNQAAHLIHAARQKKRPDEVPWTPVAADDADDGEAEQKEVPKARVEQAARESVRNATKKAYKQALTFYLDHESLTQVPLMEAWVTPFDSAKYFSKPWHLLQEVKDGGG